MNTRLVIGIICYTMLSPSIAWALAKKLIRPPAVPASIAQADLVEGCPIDRAPHSLRSAIDELVSKTRESVSKLDDAQTAALCRTQAEELESAGADEGISDDDSSDQDEQSHINSAVRKATALRGVTAKATALLSNGCIGKTADRASIVRLVGQVITAGVSVLGPVPGLIASLGGEIIARLPFWKSPLDKALEGFRDYEKSSSHAAFLCLYRQMRKYDSLLFIHQNETVVHGLDLRFKTGVTRKTRDVVAQYKAMQPELFAEAEFLEQFATRAKSALSLEGLLSLCGKLVDPDHIKTLHSEIRRELGPDVAIIQLKKACSELDDFRYPSKEKEAAFLGNAERAIQILSHYRDSLLSDQKHNVLGAIIATLDSLHEFEIFIETIEKLREATGGNQLRLNYHRLTEALGKSLARAALDDLLAEDLSHLAARDARRDRALFALLDLCQTFDPTQVCLTIGDLGNDAFLLRWRKSCDGPKSKICRAANKFNVKTTLEQYPSYRAYHRKLCL